MGAFKDNIPLSTWSECSPQCLRRQIWPFGSRLGLSEFSYWQACYRISSKTLVGFFFLDLSQNVALNV